MTDEPLDATNAEANAEPEAETEASLSGVAVARAGDGDDEEREGLSEEELLPPAWEAREWSRPWMGAFLASLAAMPNVTAAARRVGISPQGARKAKARDVVFSAAWDEAVQEGLDVQHRYLHNLATTGLEFTETHTVRERGLVDGALVVTKEKTVEIRRREFSPQVAMWLMAAHRPDVYRRPSKFELTGAEGGPIETANVSKEKGDAIVGDLTSRIDELSARRSARDAADGAGGEASADEG